MPEEQNNNVTVDPEMVAIGNKYTDLKIVDHDDLACYTHGGRGYHPIKEYGVETTQPRIMVGKIYADVLALTIKERDKFREELDETRTERDQFKRQITDVQNDRDYYQRNHSTMVDKLETCQDELGRLRTRAIEFEGHLGALRSEVGLERCVELLGK